MPDGGWSSGAWGQVGWGMSLFERDVSETATVTDVDAVAGSVFVGAVTETSTGTDSVSAIQSFASAINETATASESALSQFRREVRIARQVSHPNVCRVYDIGEVDGLTYLTMEYIDGEDLGSLLRRIGRLPADKATEFARKLCAGVAAAHAQGVLHRDLKPSNILVTPDGEVKLLDFGIAGLLNNAGMQADSQLTLIAGRRLTPAYAAPEQIRGGAIGVALAPIIV